MVQLVDVRKTYRSGKREIHALEGVSVHVAPREFVAIQGPSGSGKSTLLFTVGGMVRPSAGEVVVAGKPLYQLPAGARAAFRRLELGFVFQLFHLVPYLSAVENVLLAGADAGASTRQRARELLTRFGMADRLTHRPSELSTGERQRVALARALLNRPKLVLADEPTGNLDSDNAETVLQYLADFRAEGGTVLLVTHDAAIAAHADRIVILKAGRVVDPSAPPSAPVSSSAGSSETL